MVGLAIAGLLIDYVLSIILAGVSFAALKKVFGFKPSPVYSLIILLILFCLLDVLLNPFVYLLDITFTVHNPDVAKFLELKENESLSQIAYFDFFDIILCFIKSCLAYFIVDKRISKKLNTN